MTNEKAVVIIDNEKPGCGRRITFTEEEKCEAFDMVIAALKAEPCGDAVRRETVRDMFCEIHCHNERSKCAFRNICKYMNHVSALPPVTPKPRTGKWVAGPTIGDGFTCSECNTRYRMYPMVYRFCPNCGAKMEGEIE